MDTAIKRHLQTENRQTIPWRHASLPCPRGLLTSTRSVTTVLFSLNVISCCLCVASHAGHATHTQAQRKVSLENFSLNSSYAYIRGCAFSHTVCRVCTPRHTPWLISNARFIALMRITFTTSLSSGN